MEIRVGAPNPEAHKPFKQEVVSEPSILTLLDEYGLSFDVPELAPRLNMPRESTNITQVDKIEPSITDLLDEYDLGFEVDLRGGRSEKAATPVINLQGQREKRAVQQELNRQSFIRVRKKLAQVALTGAAVAGALIGYSIVDNNTSGIEFATEAPASPTTEAPTTTQIPATTKAPSTTTTSPPTPEVREITFEAGPGEFVGTLEAPSICLEAEIFGFSEQEKTEVEPGEAYHPTIGNGDAVIDQLRPEDSQVPSCPTIEEREAVALADTGINHTTRREYGAQQYQAIAGHEQHATSGYIAPFPGQPGNTVIGGHGSTYSAPFSDINFLQTGEHVYFTRADGVKITYEVIEQQTLPNNDYDPFLTYQSPDYSSTATIYRCGDIDGTTGSANIRVAVRLGQIDIEYSNLDQNYYL